MNNHIFHKLADILFKNVEKNIDDYCGKSDIDFEINTNMIVITFENKSKIIINRQEPLHQIWLATKNLGYHFKYVNKQWICNRTHKNFWNVLEESCSNQANEKITFYHI
ncbi:MAG: iron donor protein CyaY [Buchnera aphidicola (Meitanaphis microgallis)]